MAIWFVSPVKLPVMLFVDVLNELSISCKKLTKVLAIWALDRLKKSIIACEESVRFKELACRGVTISGLTKALDGPFDSRLTVPSPLEMFLFLKITKLA